MRSLQMLKEFLKAALYRLETTDLKEEGAGVKKKKERDPQLFSKGGHEPTDACTLTRGKQPAIVTPCKVAEGSPLLDTGVNACNGFNMN